ncbi:MAG: hypothetical protein K6C94_09270 [Candidatus Gastranaerophilales bacterium]|nr:hypothetical protein [Candidatus Gastranaerophilales bacterium]
MRKKSQIIHLQKEIKFYKDSLKFLKKEKWKIQAVIKMCNAILKAAQSEIDNEKVLEYSKLVEQRIKEGENMLISIEQGILEANYNLELFSAYLSIEKSFK